MLGISPEAQESDIKKAYARLLRQTRPDEDPEGFQELVEARNAAIGHVRKEAARQRQGTGAGFRLRLVPREPEDAGAEPQSTPQPAADAAGPESAPAPPDMPPSGAEEHESLLLFMNAEPVIRLPEKVASASSAPQTGLPESIPPFMDTEPVIRLPEREPSAETVPPARREIARPSGIALHLSMPLKPGPAVAPQLAADGEAEPDPSKLPGPS